MRLDRCFSRRRENSSPAFGSRGPNSRPPYPHHPRKIAPGTPPAAASSPPTIRRAVAPSRRPASAAFVFLYRQSQLRCINSRPRGRRERTTSCPWHCVTPDTPGGVNCPRKFAHKSVKMARSRVNRRLIFAFQVSISYFQLAARSQLTAFTIWPARATISPSNSNPPR